MWKKALRNTFIFSLIAINLILWPTLFSYYKEGTGGDTLPSLSGMTSVQNGESPAEPSTSPDSFEDQEDAATVSHEKNEDKGQEFKILQIK